MALAAALPLASATALDLHLKLDERIADTVSLRTQPIAVIKPASVGNGDVEAWQIFGEPPPVVLQFSRWRLDRTPALGISAAVVQPIGH
mgnify:CR=1 FL=1